MTSAVAPDAADQHVFGGANSHADTVHVAVISSNGGHLADAEFTTTAGYVAALAFLVAHGHVVALSVEGTASYEAGFTRAALSERAHATRSAVKARPAALNQISHLLVTAPQTIRAKHERLTGTARTETLARLRPPATRSTSRP